LVASFFSENRDPLFRTTLGRNHFLTSIKVSLDHLIHCSPRRNQPRKRAMENGEVAYLALAITAMVIFILAVAYADSTSIKH